MAAQATLRQSTTATRPGNSLGALHWMLGLQSVVVILVALNRRGDWTTGYVADNEFLRWVDLVNLLVLPIASLAATFLVKSWLEARIAPAIGRAALAIGAAQLAFVIGVYVLGAGYGEHEVTNYLNLRFCSSGEQDRLCELIRYHDDEFSHWLFFAGFLVVNGALLGLQAFTARDEALGRTDIALLALNSLTIAAGIFANLAFEATGFDLPVVGALFVAAAVLTWRLGRRPLFVYYASAYGIGLAATVAYKLA